MRRLRLASGETPSDQLVSASQLLSKFEIADVWLASTTFAATAVIAGSRVSLVMQLAKRTMLMGLKTVALDLELLSVTEIAMLCSSLRCGSRLEQIAINGTLAITGKSKCAASWCWLAFALFYPLSKTLAAGDRLKAIDVSLSVADLEWLAALELVMKDPAAALLLPGAAAKHQVTKVVAQGHEKLVCTAKNGALLYPSARVSHNPPHKLKRECQLDVLVQKGGWSCAVLPGIGLGWVKNDEVL